jgi:hypothetical protein
MAILFVFLMLCYVSDVFAHPIVGGPQGGGSQISDVSQISGDVCNDGEILENVSETWTCVTKPVSGGGSPQILDIGDDASNESTNISELATTGDTNSIVTEPSADKVLFDMGNAWPAADALSADPGNCGSGSFASGISATGSAQGCTDLLSEAELDTEAELEAQLTDAANVILATEIDTQAELEGILTDATNMISASEINTEAELEAIMGGLDLIVGTEIDSLAELSTKVGTTVLGSTSTISALSDVDATANAADDEVMIGNGTVFEGKPLLDCDTTDNFLQYDVTTNAFSCGVTTGGDDIPEAGDYTNLTGGDGITNSPIGTVSVDILTSGADGDSVNTSADGFLEFIGGELSLLRGCTDNQIPKWDETNDIWECSSDLSGAGGSAIILDISDDATNESTDLVEIATTGTDTNSIFTEPTADKLLINVGAAWPTADALAANGANCSAGNYPLGVDASGAVESCTADDDVPESGDFTNLTGGNGISNTAGTLAITPVTSGSDADSTTTQSDSGTEFVGSQLTLLRGCADNEILKWDETQDDWNCEADVTGGTQSLDDAYNNGDTITAVDTFATAVRIEDTATTTAMNIFNEGGEPVLEGRCAGATCDVKLEPTTGKSIVLTSPDTVGTTTWGPNGNITLTGTHIRRKSIFLPAGSAETDEILCTEPEKVTLSPSDDYFFRVINCQDNDNANFQFSVVMPDSWSATGITVEATIFSTDSAPSGNYELNWTGTCTGDGDVVTGSLGTEVPTVFTLATQNVMEVVTSSTLTPGGGCQGGDILRVRGRINAAGTTTTQIATTYFYGAKVEYEVNTVSD